MGKSCIPNQVVIRKLKFNHFKTSQLIYFINTVFNDVNEAYSDFTDKLMSVIDEVAPTKEACVIKRTADWFDGEVVESIKEAFLKTIKQSKLQIDKE